MHLPAALSGGVLFEVFEWTELPLRVQRLRVRDHTASTADKLIHRSSVNGQPRGARHALVWS